MKIELLIFVRPRYYRSARLIAWKANGLLAQKEKQKLQSLSLHPPASPGGCLSNPLVSLRFLCPETKMGLTEIQPGFQMIERSTGNQTGVVNQFQLTVSKNIKLRGVLHIFLEDQIPKSVFEILALHQSPLKTKSFERSIIQKNFRKQTPNFMRGSTFLIFSKTPLSTPKLQYI